MDQPTAAPRTGPVLGVVFLTLFLDLVGFSIVFPLFAAKLDYYLTRHASDGSWLFQLVHGLNAWGPPDQQAALFGGLLGGLYAGLQFFTAPLWGRLSDRIGRRPVLLVSLVGSFIAYGLWVVSADFTLFFISRIIAGAMSGNVATANAAVSDVTTAETRSRGMAVVGMAFGLGFVVGPAIGGMTAGWRIDGGTAAVGAIGLHPFSGPALIAAILATINLVWAFTSFRETLPPERRSGAVEGGRTANPLKIFDPALGAAVPRLNGAFLMFTLLFSGMETTLVFLAAHRLSFTPMDLGFLFTGLGLGSAMVQGGVFRRFDKRFGVANLGLVGLVVMFPAYLLIGATDWFPRTGLLVAGISLLAISSGLVFPALSTLVSLAGDPKRQGWVMGTFRSASALGRVVGPLLASAIYFTWRPGGAYLACAILVIIPVVLLRRSASVRN